MAGALVRGVVTTAHNADRLEVETSIGQHMRLSDPAAYARVSPARRSPSRRSPGRWPADR
ncbi:hypothetical protein GCM10027280_10000 [Micromonospora polyrhachis]